jgi:hypothetical protein
MNPSDDPVDSLARLDRVRPASPPAALRERVLASAREAWRTPPAASGLWRLCRTQGSWLAAAAVLLLGCWLNGWLTAGATRPPVSSASVRPGAAMELEGVAGLLASRLRLARSAPGEEGELSLRERRAQVLELLQEQPSAGTAPSGVPPRAHETSTAADKSIAWLRLSRWTVPTPGPAMQEAGGPGQVEARSCSCHA